MEKDGAPTAECIQPDEMDVARVMSGLMVRGPQRLQSPVTLLQDRMRDEDGQDVQDFALALVQERYDALDVATTTAERSNLFLQLRHLWVFAHERDLERVTAALFPRMSPELALEAALHHTAPKATTFLLDRGALGDHVGADTLASLAQRAVDAGAPERAATWEAVLWRLVETARGDATRSSEWVPTHGRWEGALCVLAKASRHDMLERCLGRWTKGTPTWTLLDHLSQAESLMGILITQGQTGAIQRMLAGGVNEEPHYRTTALRQAMAGPTTEILELILAHTPQVVFEAWGQQDRLLSAAVRDPSQQALRALVPRVGDMTATLSAWLDNDRWSEVERVLAWADFTVQDAWVARHPTAFPQLVAQQRDRQTADAGGPTQHLRRRRT